MRPSTRRQLKNQREAIQHHLCRIADLQREIEKLQIGLGLRYNAEEQRLRKAAEALVPDYDYYRQARLHPPPPEAAALQEKADQLRKARIPVRPRQRKAATI